MSGRDSLIAARRIKVETTHERWFDVDEEKLRAYYGEDVPDDLSAEVDQWVSEGDGIPAWLVERDSERDYGVEVQAFDLCARHDRIKEPTFRTLGGEPECSACWLEAHRG